MQGTPSRSIETLMAGVVVVVARRCMIDQFYCVLEDGNAVKKTEKVCVELNNACKEQVTLA